MTQLFKALGQLRGSKWISIGIEIQRLYSRFPAPIIILLVFLGYQDIHRDVRSVWLGHAMIRELCGAW